MIMVQCDHAHRSGIAGCRPRQWFPTTIGAPCKVVVVENPSDLAFDQCAGYKVPLFLGGEDSIHNLELSDIEVYWSLMAQLRLATIDLAPGTRISEIEFG